MSSQEHKVYEWNRGKAEVGFHPSPQDAFVLDFFEKDDSVSRSEYQSWRRRSESPRVPLHRRKISLILERSQSLSSTIRQYRSSSFC